MWVVSKFSISKRAKKMLEYGWYTPYRWTNPDQPFSFLPQPPDSLPAVSLDLLNLLGPGTKVAVAKSRSGEDRSILNG